MQTQTAVGSILADIVQERHRQEQLRADGKFKATCATTCPDQMGEAECFTVLAEEMGEVARAILECDQLTDMQFVRDELIQVAAVCVAWIERIDQK